MRALFRTVLTQNRLAVLLAYNVAGCLIIFGLLELWRPCYFLTDDNLCDGFPFLTEMGRHLRNGEFPFISDYLFGGHYDWSRDVGCLSWHPFYLIPVLLADTWAKYWIMEAIALPYLLMTTIGFTFLAYQLRNEFKLTICDGWLILYTLSFVFSMYTMMVGASWLCFLGNQSALPWLTIGIMDRKLTRGVFIVILVTIHQFVSSYAGMTLSTTLLLTFSPRDFPSADTRAAPSSSGAPATFWPISSSRLFSSTSSTVSPTPSASADSPSKSRRYSPFLRRFFPSRFFSVTGRNPLSKYWATLRCHP